jgi:hypothetical protein
MFCVLGITIHSQQKAFEREPAIAANIAAVDL